MPPVNDPGAPAVTPVVGVTRLGSASAGAGSGSGAGAGAGASAGASRLGGGGRWLDGDALTVQHLEGYCRVGGVCTACSGRHVGHTTVKPDRLVGGDHRGRRGGIAGDDLSGVDASQRQHGNFVVRHADLLWVRMRGGRSRPVSQGLAQTPEMPVSACDRAVPPTSQDASSIIRTARDAVWNSDRCGSAVALPAATSGCTPVAPAECGSCSMCRVASDEMSKAGLPMAATNLPQSSENAAVGAAVLKVSTRDRHEGAAGQFLHERLRAGGGPNAAEPLRHILVDEQNRVDRLGAERVDQRPELSLDLTDGRRSAADSPHGARGAAGGSIAKAAGCDGGSCSGRRAEQHQVVGQYDAE